MIFFIVLDFSKQNLLSQKAIKFSHVEEHKS